MIQFEEWWETRYLRNYFGGAIKEMNQRAYAAGYNQRSKEVAEDLRLFNNLMDNIKLDPDE